MNVGNKKIVSEINIDPETGIKFVEDIRGNIHCIMDMGNSGTGDINITLDGKLDEDSEKKAKRYRKILEALRMENNWLWEVVYKTIKEKKTPKQAIEKLEKAIKERTR